LAKDATHEISEKCGGNKKEKTEQLLITASVCAAGNRAANISAMHWRGDFLQRVLNKYTELLIEYVFLLMMYNA
jgi:hypothetical protein